MRSLSTIILIMLLAVSCTGCLFQKGYTENYQALTARTSTDTAMTVTAEEAGMNAADMKIIGQVATDIETFLSGGQVMSLTNGNLANELNTRVPIAYRSYFAALLSYLSGQNIDMSELVSPKVLRLMQNAVHGVRTACEKWVDPVESSVQE